MPILVKRMTIIQSFSQISVAVKNNRMWKIRNRKRTHTKKKQKSKIKGKINRQEGKLSYSLVHQYFAEHSQEIPNL